MQRTFIDQRSTLFFLFFFLLNTLKVSAAFSDNIKVLLGQAYDTFNVPRKGVIHVGAHKAEELPVYRSLRISETLWIEANPNLEKLLTNKLKAHPGAELAMFAASESEEEADFYMKRKASFCSLLPFENHKGISLGNTEIMQVSAKPLDDFLNAEKREKYNVMVVDTQGAVLKVLKGAEKTLAHMDAIVPEVAFSEVMHNTGGPVINELDAFLLEQGFIRMTTLMHNIGVIPWGDALYMRKTFLEKDQIGAHLAEKMQKNVQQRRITQRRRQAQKRPQSQGGRRPQQKTQGPIGAQSIPKQASQRMSQAKKRPASTGRGKVRR